MDNTPINMDMYLTGQSDVDTDSLPSNDNSSSLTTVSTWNFAEESIFKNLFDEIIPSNAFADDPITNLAEGIQGFDATPPQLFDINYDDLVNVSATIPNENPIQSNPPLVREASSKLSIIKSTDESKATFMDNSGYYYMNASLQLTIPPLNYQRARREKELEETIRYIFVPHDAVMTLTMSNHPSHIDPQMSFFLRITRLTKPYGSDQLMFYHPYPLWLKDSNSRVYNNSLFLPITTQSIRINKVALERLRQGVLERMKQFPVFSANQLSFAGFHSLNASKRKAIISKYELRYSILHFQVCVINRNNCIYPTDLQCQTEPIYEYDAQELNNLPPYVRQLGQASNKRKTVGQRKQSSKKTKMEHMAEEPHLPV